MNDPNRPKAVYEHPELPADWLRCLMDQVRAELELIEDSLLEAQDTISDLEFKLGETQNELADCKERM